MRFARLAGLALLVLSTGCRHVSGEVHSQPVSVVLDSLKTELSLFAHSTPGSGKLSAGVCESTAGKVLVELIPRTATLELKVVTSDTTTDAAGIKVVAGDILTINPGVSATKTRVSTQDLMLDLEIEHTKNSSEIRSDIESLAKSIESDTRAAETIRSVDTETSSRLMSGTRKAKLKLVELYKDLFSSDLESSKALNLALGEKQKMAASSAGASNKTPLAQKRTPLPPKELNGHALALTLWGLREQLLRVDHDKAPCLKPNQLKTQIAFQATDSFDAQGNIILYVVNVGEEVSHTDDVTQTMTVVFDMARGSPLLAK